jgi:protein-disulfide isomerase
MNRRRILQLGAVAIVACVAGTGMLWRSAQQRDAAQVAATNMTLLVRAHAPTQGGGEASVHIVEFMDPACETCRSFAPLVKQMLVTHPGAIRLSVRHLALHEGSEVPVRILEASRAQDKYWETLAALLSSQPKWVFNHRVQTELVWDQIQTVGLDLERLRRDMDSPEVTQRIAQDRADAKALKVTMTPEFFVNGRPLPSFGYEELNNLVQQELAAGL